MSLIFFYQFFIIHTSVFLNLCNKILNFLGKGHRFVSLRLQSAPLKKCYLLTNQFKLELKTDILKCLVGF